MSTTLATVELPRSPEENPAASYLARLKSKSSRDTMRRQLNALARRYSNGQRDALTFPWWELRAFHVAAIRAHLMETRAPATVNKALMAIRGVLKRAVRQRLMSQDDFDDILEIELLPPSGILRGRMLTFGEIGRLMKVTQDGTLAGERDGALIAVLAGTGMRRTELVRLDVGDYDQAEQSILIRFGKGGKSRLVYIEEAAPILNIWLKRRRQYDEDLGRSSPLFVPFSKSGQPLARRLSSSAVWALLQARGEQAGLENFTTHDFRRSAASNLLEAGEDPKTVADVLGHSSIETTMRYDRRGDQRKKRAAGKLRLSE